MLARQPVRTQMHTDNPEESDMMNRMPIDLFFEFLIFLVSLYKAS
jgi:hypothetical protein